MTGSANPWMSFLESVSVGRSMSEVRSLCYVPALLIYYSFDLYGYRVDECIQRWLDRFKGDWLRLAIVEALYQGRYKSISIEQILHLWQRRGQPICHFNHEFEQIVCSKLPEELLPLEYLHLTLDMRSVAGELPPEVEEPQEQLLKDVSDEDEGEQSVPKPIDSMRETETESEEGEKSLDSEPTASGSDLVTESSESDDSPIALELESDEESGRSDRPPIDQFSPPLPTSEFYLKLQALARDSPPTG